MAEKVVEKDQSGQDWDVIVVGGGAAGVFAAIAAAEACPGLQVLVLEKAKELLGKVRISGGGRCNVTHACFDPAELVERYPRGRNELRGPFHSWQPEDTVRWFEERGVKLKVEEDGRMFPVTDNSATIVDCLVRSARDAGVHFRTRCGVADACRDANEFVVRVSDGMELRCKRLLIATGGLRPGGLMKVIEGFGHTIESLAPSLFTFHVADPRIEGLQGVAVNGAEASIPGTPFVHRGPVLVTHWGLSGPVILKLSAWAARWAHEKKYRFVCRVNWMAEKGEGAVRDELTARRGSLARKLVRKMSFAEIPLRLWERLVSAADIGQERQWGQLRKEELEALVAQLTATKFEVTGKSMFKEEFVTCGGVSLKEVHFKTMESRLVPGLYFAGEVLDIDGITGGFNFQSAWTTGVLAGRAVGR